MKNFDVENSLNPFLVKGTLLIYNRTICKVINMTKSQIIIEDARDEIKRIGDSDWEEIELNEYWLGKFGFEIGSFILNCETNDNWQLMSNGKFYYLTVRRDVSFGDNPIIGIKTVNELQEWFYRLTKQTLSI